MYRPAYFDVADVARIHDLIDTIPFVHLVSHDGDGLDATPLPMMLRRGDGPLGTLVGHVARPNPQWRALQVDGRALAIISGPDAYISPSTYASKAVDPKVVPTWNYTVVHAEGTVIVHDDAGWLRQLVTDLTERHEGARGVPDPWHVSDAPDDYIERTLRGIIGIELRIERLEGKHKLSQNKPEPDARSAAAALQAIGGAAAAVGAAMNEAR